MPVANVVSDTKVPIKLWLPIDSVEPNAMKQLINTANLPGVVKHVAVMPDCHMGWGAPVGSVVAMKGTIAPAITGVDIGCGMAAVKTNLDPDKVLAKTGEIAHSIQRSVPTGFNMNRVMTPEVETWWKAHSFPYEATLPTEKVKRAQLQLGSLGGGNHFIEVCLDKDRNVWAMLHSGSRHVGLYLAERYIGGAKDLMKHWRIELPDPYLAYIPEGEPMFHDYWNALCWAQDYAMENRAEMMRRVLKDLAYAINDGKEVERVFEVNCHHNYADREHHFGDDVIVVRKGATRAREGEFGIIPGSMGAKSYIVRGKGEAQSFCSSSHGAGRRMGRKEAKRQFTVKDLEEQMQGIEGRKDAGVLDEIPSAYKSIDDVIQQQSDLVEPIAELKQVISIKGGGNPDKD
jgi:tRNA-splicing ligase RtcB (3'-phosphate/5'-hydroxy nucleic acid ligase)